MRDTTRISTRTAPASDAIDLARAGRARIDELVDAFVTESSEFRALIANTEGVFSGAENSGSHFREGPARQATRCRHRRLPMPEKCTGQTCDRCASCRAFRHPGHHPGGPAISHTQSERREK